MTYKLSDVIRWLRAYELVLRLEVPEDDPDLYELRTTIIMMELRS